MRSRQNVKQPVFGSSKTGNIIRTSAALVLGQLVLGGSDQGWLAFNDVLRSPGAGRPAPNDNERSRTAHRLIGGRQSDAGELIIIRKSYGRRSNVPPQSETTAIAAERRHFSRGVYSRKTAEWWRGDTFGSSPSRLSTGSAYLQPDR